MNVVIFGGGYVGCVTAAGLARLGHRVSLVEISDYKLRMLRRGQSPVKEPGVGPLLGRWVNRRIFPTANVAEALVGTDLSMICVGTPGLPGGSADTAQIRKIVGEIGSLTARNPEPYLVVLRSTVPYSQIESDILPIVARLNAHRTRPLEWALNPEFLREGSALEDFRRPPFVVVGTDAPRAAARLKALYRAVPAPVLFLSPGSASLLKYACNAFHALKVSFANEIASLAPIFRADAVDVMDVFCRDKALNISSAYLRPGFAYGGSCLPKDTKAMAAVASLQGVRVPLLESLPASNGLPLERALRLVEHLGVRRVKLVGLTFKEGTDDLRESPLVALAKTLLGEGFQLKIFDPDVQLKALHGNNLSFVQQNLHHLTQWLCPTWREFVDGEGVVVLGKNLLNPARARELVRRGLAVVDLTQRLDKVFPELNAFRVNPPFPARDLSLKKASA